MIAMRPRMRMRKELSKLSGSMRRRRLSGPRTRSSEEDFATDAGDTIMIYNKKRSAIEAYLIKSLPLFSL